MPQPEFGATAWGRVWLRTVERTDDVPNPHLPKARSLARNQKAAVNVAPGAITADVADGSATHQVSIQLPRWDEREQAITDRILADISTDSIVGDLPDQLLSTLTAADVIVAVAVTSATAVCTCRSRTRPCAHVLATLYAFVLLVDERPLTALEVRGSESSRSRTDLGWIPLEAIDPATFYTSSRS